MRIRWRVLNVSIVNRTSKIHKLVILTTNKFTVNQYLYVIIWLIEYHIMSIEMISILSKLVFQERNTSLRTNIVYNWIRKCRVICSDRWNYYFRPRTEEDELTIRAMIGSRFHI